MVRGTLVVNRRCFDRACPVICATARPHPAAEPVLTLPPGGGLLKPQKIRGLSGANSCPYQLECLDIPPERSSRWTGTAQSLAVSTTPTNNEQRTTDNWTKHCPDCWPYQPECWAVLCSLHRSPGRPEQGIRRLHTRSCR